MALQKQSDRFKRNDGLPKLYAFQSTHSFERTCLGMMPVRAAEAATDQRDMPPTFPRLVPLFCQAIFLQSHHFLKTPFFFGRAITLQGK